MQKYRLNLTVLLPHMEAGDDCIRLLTDRLSGLRGVDLAHIVRTDGAADLCLHFDPNLVSLGRLQRLARQTGAQITERYRHEEIPITGMEVADGAFGLTRALQNLPGMLHAQVSYATGLAFVAYDTDRLTRTAVEQTIRSLGYGVTAQTAAQEGTATTHAEPAHDHGHAPGFLPHRLQEQWPLVLIAMAACCLLIGFVGERLLGLPRDAAIAVFALAYLAGGYEVAAHAVPGLLKGQFDTDVLMLAAAIGAAMLGKWAEGAFLLLLFGLGHAGEHYALDRARNAINALGALMPKTARVRRGDTIVETPVEQLALGDVVVVRPGDRVPVDGVVTRGATSVDQSPITGESVPVRKELDDEVYAGTVNQDATVDVKTTALAADNTLSRVMRLVREAQSQQSPTQQFTNRFTNRFVPLILIGDLLLIVAPPLLGWMPWSQSFYRGMLLLVAASPCALAIGTPAAVLAGIAQAARNGVLIKGGVHLENLGGLKALAFDKTGTLTQGKFVVTDIELLNGATRNQLLQTAAAVEQHANHPLAQAVVRQAEEDDLGLPPTTGLENIAGRGVRSMLNGQPVLIGSLDLFRTATDHPLPDDVVQTVARLEKNGRSTMTISHNGRFLGVLGSADVARVEAGPTMQRLHKQGVNHLIMLTGDNPAVAQRIAAEIGLTDVQARLLPADKLQVIQDLVRRYGSIGMVGDGVNDAPALAAATVGIAMGGAGTAVALETADVALMADDLSMLPFAVGLGRASRAVIRQNLSIALGVIVLLIAASVLGWVQLGAAVVLHEGSTLVVVLNALRLLQYRENET